MQTRRSRVCGQLWPVFVAVWGQGYTNYYGKLFLSSQNWVFRPNVRVLLGGEAKNTDRLLKILPAVFCELSGTIFRFSGALVYFLEQPISFLLEALKSGCWSELGPEIMDVWRIGVFFMKNHDVLVTGNMDEQSNHDSFLGKLRGAS